MEHLLEPVEQSNELLQDGEKVLVVDDFPEIVLLLQEFLASEDIPAIMATSAAELQKKITENNVALVLLDIGLPDADGQSLIPMLKEQNRDLSIVMLTAVNDLQTALSCIRHGADDYLTKPVNFADLLSTLHRTLEKRRLTINNRLYQRQLEQARFRLQLAHELANRMNTAFLSLVELDGILQAILIGITAESGLQFNRAFLALFNDEETVLEGRMAIGPANREDGGRIWQNIQDLELDFHDLLSCSDVLASDVEVNRIVKAMQVDAADDSHIFMKAVRTRKPIQVQNGKCEYPVPIELIGLLQEESFVIVPLFSSSRSLGVIVADHFITRQPITSDRIHALESFASQASLAIEHCRLYMDMENKISELESMAAELEKNKNLLVDAERYSAVGHMAAQLAHSIRNPITSIGGTARLLARKTDNPEWLQFLNMMTAEAEKVETILENLFGFVERIQPQFKHIDLVPIVRKSLLLHASLFKEKNIKNRLVAPDHELSLFVDPELLQTALVHLIRNSIDAMADGGELTITIISEEDMIRILLVDTGVGIKKSNLSQVADPFFTTKTVGAGMGLALVQKIIEDHHGTFQIQADDGGGTKVVIRLPV